MRSALTTPWKRNLNPESTETPKDLDLNDKKIANGFKLYNSYHIGYHFAFGKKKQFFIEPQFHCNFWHFDTNTPDSFKQLDNKWDSYFLFEPNLYIGIKF